MCTGDFPGDNDNHIPNDNRNHHCPFGWCWRTLTHADRFGGNRFECAFHILPTDWIKCQRGFSPSRVCECGPDGSINTIDNLVCCRHHHQPPPQSERIGHCLDGNRFVYTSCTECWMKFYDSTHNNALALGSKPIVGSIFFLRTDKKFIVSHESLVNRPSNHTNNNKDENKNNPTCWPWMDGRSFSVCFVRNRITYWTLAPQFDWHVDRFNLMDFFFFFG